jgi:hypothetical protein
MVYVAAVMSDSAGRPHAHPGAGVPMLTGVLLLHFVGYVLLSGFRLVPVTAGPGRAAPRETVAGRTATGEAVAGGAGWGDPPEPARACRLSMGIAVLAMLLTL